MTTYTATRASREFSALLDRVERGDEVEISRGGRVVAVPRPPPRSQVREFNEFLATLPGLGDELASIVKEGQPAPTIPEIPRGDD